jgi:predicted phosphohydrolase
MKFQYCSDLHLEFPDNRKYLNANPLKPSGEVLLLAGDIIPFAKMNKHPEFFDFVSDHFDSTYWLPGNHEYYHGDIAGWSGAIHEKIRSNVYLVNNIAITLLDVQLVFSTLWSKISPLHQWMIQQDIADFHLIKYRGSSLTTTDFNNQHELCLQFLQKELTGKAEKTIVVTHHVPTFYNYPLEYKGSVLNEAFASEQFDLIEKTGASYWVYGHHHKSNPEFSIGSTRLVNNQLGYVESGEHKKFDQKACLYFD